MATASANRREIEHGDHFVEIPGGQRLYVSRPVADRYVEIRKHFPPDEACRCGIYGHKSREWVIKNYGGYPAIQAIGTVLLWGKVIEGEYGYRAEFARIERLMIQDPVRRAAIALRYGVPVVESFASEADEAIDA